MAKPITAFVAAFLFCWLVAWVGGFNFDQRNQDVAFGLVIATLIGVVAAIATKLE